MTENHKQLSAWFNREYLQSVLPRSNSPQRHSRKLESPQLRTSRKPGSTSSSPRYMSPIHTNMRHVTELSPVGCSVCGPKQEELGVQSQNAYLRDYYETAQKLHSVRDNSPPSRIQTAKSSKKIGRKQSDLLQRSTGKTRANRKSLQRILSKYKQNRFLEGVVVEKVQEKKKGWNTDSVDQQELLTPEPEELECQSHQAPEIPVSQKPEHYKERKTVYQQLQRKTQKKQEQKTPIQGRSPERHSLEKQNGRIQKRNFTMGEQQKIPIKKPDNKISFRNQVQEKVQQISQQKKQEKKHVNYLVQKGKIRKQKETIDQKEKKVTSIQREIPVYQPHKNINIKKPTKRSPVRSGREIINKKEAHITQEYSNEEPSHNSSIRKHLDPQQSDIQSQVFSFAGKQIQQRQSANSSQHFDQKQTFSQVKPSNYSIERNRVSKLRSQNQYTPSKKQDSKLQDFVSQSIPKSIPKPVVSNSRVFSLNTQTTQQVLINRKNPTQHLKIQADQSSISISPSSRNSKKFHHISFLTTKKASLQQTEIITRRNLSNQTKSERILTTQIPSFQQFFAIQTLSAIKIQRAFREYRKTLIISRRSEASTQTISYPFFSLLCHLETEPALRIYKGLLLLGTWAETLEVRGVDLLDKILLRQMTQKLNRNHFIQIMRSIVSCRRVSVTKSAISNLT